MNAMQEAIKEAQLGVSENHGGPFGAVIVKNNEIIARAHNTVIINKDCTCHAEMNAIRAACKKLDTHILSGCELYTTAEPCPMCYTAISWARIDKLYIGIDKVTAAEYGFDDAEFYRQISLSSNDRKIEQNDGIMFKECEDIFKEWKKLNRPLY